MAGYNKEDLAALLRDARLHNKMSVEEVATALKAYGQEIAPKSIYNYEKGMNMPQVPMFIALCRVYGIEDPIAALDAGYTRKIEVTAKEEFLLERFRKASPEMQDAALRVLEPIEEESINSLVG